MTDVCSIILLFRVYAKIAFISLSAKELGNDISVATTLSPLLRGGKGGVRIHQLMLINTHVDVYHTPLPLSRGECRKSKQVFTFSSKKRLHLEGVQPFRDYLVIYLLSSRRRSR